MKGEGTPIGTSHAARRPAAPLRPFVEVLWAVDRAGATPAAGLATLAQAAGYSDQAHLCREFREFSGMSPVEYRRLSLPRPYHVPMPPR